ncbi:Glycosyl transferase family 2 [Streptomyces sp. TLI_053]|uniref:glycosyltransferase family 2 protein n=1 Tax=Streptomyces sp. TLI_053 TaxID=1855352 RepID=UPI00087AF780|nr:glycosyltransferase family 2 protein [Streptomyces sp. TLI_053]SDS55273.1 Glycosyl transferase family 2 [Streptomyces sp. TLI_053]
MLIHDLLDRPDTHPGPALEGLALISGMSPQLAHLPVPAGDRRHRTAPRVTAVVLTQDEEDTIGRCLDALTQDVDEALIVDSGSSDRTLDIVAAHPLPTRVVHAPWQEDFAHQRNLALDHVHDGWVLMIDADEVLAPADAGTVRRAAVLLDHILPHADLAACPLVLDDHDPAGRYPDLPRLVRARTALRYRGRIHERPYDSDGNAPPTVHLTTVLRHHGYHPTVITAKAKLDRHARLTALCRAEEPDNPKWVFYQARAELPQHTGPEAARSLFGRLAAAPARDGLPPCDYTDERRQDTWVLLCELALRFGGSDEIDTYTALLERAGRGAEATYFRTVVTTSRSLRVLAGLADTAADAVRETACADIRVMGRLHELHGLLSLATGRYEHAAPALGAALALGAGTFLSAELERLREEIGPKDPAR